MMEPDAEALEMETMDRKIDALANHYILCGAGRTGRHILGELLASRRPFVVLDIHRPALEEFPLKSNERMLWLQGDATDEKLLVRAGIRRAAGIYAVLSNDKDNLYLTFLARQQAREHNSTLRIVSRAIDYELIPLIRKAGADAVISPNLIGGLRMASELVRPAATAFLDRMMKNSDEYRFEEIVIHDDSEWVGKTLGETKIGEQNRVQIVALRYPGKEDFIYQPSPDRILEAGAVIVVIGPGREMKRIRDTVVLPETE